MSAALAVRFKPFKPMMESDGKLILSDRDVLIQVRERLSNLIEATRSNQTTFTQEMKDHEGRLRVLENFRWWILGAAAAAGFMGSFVARFVGK